MSQWQRMNSDRQHIDVGKITGKGSRHSMWMCLDRQCPLDPSSGSVRRQEPATTGQSRYFPKQTVAQMPTSNYTQ